MIGLFAAGLGSFFALALAANAITVSISATPSHPIPTALWGATLDEVNHAIEGGLYAEMIKNRAFQKVIPGTPEALDGWHSIGGAEIEVIKETVPLSLALPNALRVTFPTNTTTQRVGFANEGFQPDGLRLDFAVYNLSFWYRFPTASSFFTDIDFLFQTPDGAHSFGGNAGARLDGSRTTWTQNWGLIFALENTGTDPLWITLTFNGTESPAGQTVHFSMLQLTGPIFSTGASATKLRLGTALQTLAPKFLRFPGGDLLLGNGSDTERWRWFNTVGSVTDRPGHMTANGYLSTDGFGLFEFFSLCENIHALPIMTVPTGLTKDGSVIPAAQLPVIVQEAIDQVNFAIGPTSTPQGALRANMGHAAPFSLQYVEIGANEENTSQEYQARWTAFVTALQQRFPQLNFIASSTANNPALTPNPTHWDTRFHKTGSWLANNSFYFDSFQRNGTKYLISEFQADEGLIAYPTLQSALQEAVFMTGIERNSDIIIGAAHSPIFNSITLTTRAPSLMSFDTILNVIFSTSFLIQQWFESTTTTTPRYVPTSTLPDPNGNLFWSVLQTDPGGPYIIKVINTGSSEMNITFVSPISIPSWDLVVVTADSPTANNNPATPTAVSSSGRTTTFSTSQNTLIPYTAAPFSFAWIHAI